MVPWTGSGPRRARHLIPKEMPRRSEVVAVCAIAILVAHLLLAQLTFVLAVAFVLVSRTSRWRLWWLLAPAAAGLTWTLAAGPDKALAGFTAGPSSILWHLGGGHLAGQPGHPFAGFSGARHWLPRQFPLALVCGAAEAAVAGWLDWLHTDEWAVPPARPGLFAAARRALAMRAIRSGTVLTREGCALGVVPSTGAIAELRWAELARGALVVGAAAQDVTVTGLQAVHAALRRRKPVIVLDLGDAAITRAVTAACLATDTPLLTGSARVHPAGAGISGGTELEAAGASQLWRRGPAPGQAAAGARPVPPRPEAVPEPAALAAVDLGQVVRERLAALLPADCAELAGRACADLASLAADLRRIGVDGDALVWVPRGEDVPAQELAALLRGGLDAGVSVLIGTTSPQVAAELSVLAGTTLAYRVADPGLAGCLAAVTGTRLLPAPVAAALAGSRPTGAGLAGSGLAGAGLARSGPAGAGLAGAGLADSGGAGPGLAGSGLAGDPRQAASVPGAYHSPLSAPAPPGPSASRGFASDAAFAFSSGAAVAPDLVPSPRLPARALLSLGQSEFVLMASSPRQRLVTAAAMVPARLPGRLR
jgi:hypothetical protein